MSPDEDLAEKPPARSLEPCGDPSLSQIYDGHSVAAKSSIESEPHIRSSVDTDKRQIRTEQNLIETRLSIPNAFCVHLQKEINDSGRTRSPVRNKTAAAQKNIALQRSFIK